MFTMRDEISAEQAALIAAYKTAINAIETHQQCAETLRTGTAYPALRALRASGMSGYAIHRAVHGTITRQGIESQLRRALAAE